MNILLSNDDGNSGIGSRLLAHVLKQMGHTLTVAGPISQQSSIGAAATPKGFTWEKFVKDGITYYEVTGTPNDAMELLATQEVTFDMVITGVNWGANVGSLIYRSGTYCAAVAGVGLQLAPKGVSISWDVPSEFWWADSSQTKLESVFETPGTMLRHILSTVFDNNLWGAELLNIVLPTQHTTDYKFVKLARFEQDGYEMTWKPTDHTFKYVGDLNRIPRDKDTDIGTIIDGKIAITPTRYEVTDYDLLGRLPDTR
jgi:5'-nucleotidase